MVPHHTSTNRTALINKSAALSTLWSLVLSMSDHWGRVEKIRARLHVISAAILWLIVF
jgi:hypothetical protein